MNQEGRGRDLFIVDNSVSGWTGLRYLEEWTSIAKGFDIATGHFEIGALLALDGKWQRLDKIRILMGAETTHRTRKAILDAVRQRAVEVLDSGIEADKEANPFLNGVPGILRHFGQGVSNAASTTAISSMPRRTSRTPSLRWSAHRRLWDPATSVRPA